MKCRIFALLIVLLIIALDQVSKHYVQTLLMSSKLQVASNFNLVSVWNHGISFGLGDKFPMANLLFIIITITISTVLSLTICRAENKMIIIGAAVVLGGAIGNIIDRLRFGSVYDFIDIYIQNVHWPAFNIADSMILIGVIMLFIGDIHAKYNSKNN